MYVFYVVEDLIYGETWLQSATLTSYVGNSMRFRIDAHCEIPCAHRCAEASRESLRGAFQAMR